MTPTSPTPQPTDRPSARRRVRQVLTRARTLWRDMTGESAYHGSGHGPMSEREFWRARAKQAETEINASCC